MPLARPLTIGLTALALAGAALVTSPSPAVTASA